MALGVLPEISDPYLAGMQSTLEGWGQRALETYYVPLDRDARRDFLRGRKVGGGDCRSIESWWPASKEA